ncbi:MAG: class IIb bacteriocin, lactobin A/cerein 7B family [Bacilli bacterium]|nr:class IIb bacteriocin, lactobin A/cerein 7B family [Bacilli bacterium]
MELNNKELKEVKGGLWRIIAVKGAAKVAIGIGIGFSFLVGLVNGYQRPLPCNTK